ncbi:MAG: extracellular solute-binding protein [Eubacterium sp.]|nr:extracellular solute-binding protein [Eubacterium sp.]
MKKRISIRRRLFAGFLAVLMIMSMAGCGKKGTDTVNTTSTTKSESDISGAVSVNAATVDEKDCAYTENTDFSIDASIKISRAVKFGENIALLSDDGSIYFKPADGGEEKLIYTAQEGNDIDNITDVDGNIGIIESKDSTKTLKTIDKDGNEISAVGLSGLDGLTLDESSSSYVVTKDGELAVTADQELILLDKEGKETKRIQFAFGLMTACLAKNGEIVVFGDKGLDKAEADVVDPKTGKTVTKLLINAPYLNGGAVQPGSGDYDFYVKKDSGLYGYKIDEKTEYMICDFNVSIIDGTNAKYCLILDMDHIFCLAYDSTAMGFNLSSYNKVNSSEVEDVETLTVAILVENYELQKDITDFNRMHPDVRIQLIDYSVEEDPIAKFSADIGAGKTTDMCDVSFGYGDISIYQAVQKGLLEDLTPYIEKDPDISEEDFLDSIMGANKIDGKTYYLGTSFQVNALLVKKSEIGDRTGWTYEEMMDYIYSKPDDVFPFKERSKQEILSQFLYGGMSQFVDWEKGECYFDSESFKSLLEYSNRGKDEESAEWDPDLPWVDDIQNGKQLFYNGVIEPTIWPLYEKFFDGDLTWIGYPDKNREGYYASMYGCIAMSTTCKDKDIAWEFIKFCASKEQMGKSYVDNAGIPTRKDVFEIFMEAKTTTTGFIDEFGNGVGTPDGIFGMGSVTVDMRPLTEEEGQAFRDLTDRVSNVYIGEPKFMDIINDECKAYFAGDKSVDETVQIIQNRAQTYMNESK